MKSTYTDSYSYPNQRSASSTENYKAQPLKTNNSFSNNAKLLPPGAQLTGNKETDEDIIAFYRAKEILLSKSANRTK